MITTNYRLEVILDRALTVYKNGIRALEGLFYMAKKHSPTTLSLKTRNSIPSLIEDALKKSSVTELDETQLNLLRLCQLITDIRSRHRENDSFAKDSKNE